MYWRADSPPPHHLANFLLLEKTSNLGGFLCCKFQWSKTHTFAVKFGCIFHWVQFPRRHSSNIFLTKKIELRILNGFSTKQFFWRQRWVSSWKLSPGRPKPKSWLHSGGFTIWFSASSRRARHAAMLAFFPPLNERWCASIWIKRKCCSTAWPLIWYCDVYIPDTIYIKRVQNKIMFHSNKSNFYLTDAWFFLVRQCLYNQSPSHS